MATMPPPRFFDFETVKKNLDVKQALGAVEAAFGMLSENKVGISVPSSCIKNAVSSSTPLECAKAPSN